MSATAEQRSQLPPIAGAENETLGGMSPPADAFRTGGGIAFDTIRSATAIALHMQQPLIPAGGDDLRAAAIISNLKYMMDHQHVGDNHNAPVFYQCYKRMGDFVPRMVD